MSEDEIIKNLNDLLEHNYLEDVCYLREEKDYVVYNNAIQGLLDLYQKEKEKNKELENSDLTTVYMKGFYDAKNKYKDKIRAKIEEVKRKREEEWETAGISMLGSAIDVLIELLEEE